MNKVLVIRVGTPEDDVKDFIKTWNKAEGREDVEPSFGVTFESIAGLLQVMTPARWTLLNHLKQFGPLTVYALAKLLQRDYKNVHTDVKALEELDIIGRTENKLVEVPWDEIETRWRLAA